VVSDFGKARLAMGSSFSVHSVEAEQPLSDGDWRNEWEVKAKPLPWLKPFHAGE
jgi:hypothetical protein